MIDYYNGVRVYMRNYIRGRPWVAGVVQSKTGPLSYTIKLDDGRLVKRHLDQIRKTLQSERHERGEPEDLPVEPIHPLDKRCSRAMVPVLLGEPEEWDVAPDLPEQQDGVDKQKEQDVMVPSMEISTGPENLETHVQATRTSTKEQKSDSSPPFQQKKRKAPDRLNFLVD